MSNRIALAFILTLFMGTRTQASLSWPNEPSTFQSVVDCNFDTSTCGGQLHDNYSNGRIATESTAPLSPSNILEQVHPPGAIVSGGAMLWRSLFNTPEVYIGFWWKMNTGFYGHQNMTNKLIFLKTNEIPSFLAAYGLPGSNFVLKHNMQNSFGISNCQLANAPSRCSPGTTWVNMANATVLRNAWHRVEIYAMRSTSSTSQDGVLKVWLNGTLIGNFSNVNWGNSGFSAFTLQHTWDGGTPNNDPTGTWIHWFDHVRISVPPPPADTQTPSMPAGLSAQAVSPTQINLTWNASTDNVGVTGYKIFRSSTQIGTATGTSYSNTGLSASTSYSYTVAAYDAARNASGQSAAASTTTHAAATGAVGTVSNLSAAAAGANSVTLSFTEVTDGAGQPAKYDVRFSSTGTLWGAARSVTQGTCATPLAGATVGAVKTCTVLGLSASTAYQFQLIAFRGTIGAGAVYGTLSNLAGATTSSAANAMPPAKPRNLRAQ